MTISQNKFFFLPAFFFAAATLCAEETSAGTDTDAGTTETPTWTPEVKPEDFYDNVAEEDRRTDMMTDDEIAANKPSGEIVPVPNLGGPTAKEIKALIHIIEAGGKVVSKLVTTLIDATDDVHGKVTISGSKNESQTGEGITFASDGSHKRDDAGYYYKDTIVAGYHIKDLYPEASKTSGIDVKNVSVSSKYAGLETVCGIYHEQGGNGAQQEFRFIKITESLSVSYFGENANAAGFWQRGTDGDGNDKDEPPYISGDVILNNLQIESHKTSGTSYGIYQDGTAHIDGNVKLTGAVLGGDAFGVKGGTYGKNLSASLTVRAYNGDAVGISLDRTAGSFNGLTDADGNVVSTGEKSTLTVVASGNAVGVLLGGNGKVSGTFKNYDIAVSNVTLDPENIAVGVYMHKGASVGSMSDLTISAKSYCGPVAGFVFDNRETATTSVGESLSRLNIEATTISPSVGDDCGRTAGIVIGKAVNFTLDNSSITVLPGNGRDCYGLAYGKDVSGETSENDGGVGVFNHTTKDSSGLNITNSQITARGCDTNDRKSSAYGLYLVGSSVYNMTGNAFTAMNDGEYAYGLYAAGTAKVSNLTTLTVKLSNIAYGVYLDGAASVDAATLTEIKVKSTAPNDYAFGIYKASAESSFNNFDGKILLETLSPKNAVYGLYYSDVAPADGASIAVYNAATKDSSGISLSSKSTIEINNRDSFDGVSKTTYGVYVSGEKTTSVPAATINVKGSGVSDVYGAYVADGEVTLAGTISVAREDAGSGKLVGLWTGTADAVSLDGAKITATAGDALASDGAMTLASVGTSAAQLTGNVSVGEKLHFTEGAFSLGAETIAAETWEVGSANASGNVATANVSLVSDTTFSGNAIVFNVKKPQTRTTQEAAISVADGATFTALATTITVVLDHNGTYGIGVVITLVGGNASFEKVDNVIVSQNGVNLSPEFYDYGNVAGGWGITFIPEPSMFGLFAGTLALALVGTRRRRSLR